MHTYHEHLHIFIEWYLNVRTDWPKLSNYYGYYGLKQIKPKLRPFMQPIMFYYNDKAKVIIKQL